MDEVLRVVRDVPPLLRRELDLLLQDILIDLFDVLAVERRLTRQQLIRDNAEAPHVDLLRVLLMKNKLRRHVEWRTQNEVKAGLRLKLTCKAEVSDLNVKVHRVLANKQYVLGLNVAMRDRLQVHIVQAEHDLMDDVGGLRLGEYGQLRQPFEQLAALHELRHHVVVVVVLDQVHDPDDVGVRLLTQNGQLVLE